MGQAEEFPGRWCRILNELKIVFVEGYPPGGEWNQVNERRAGSGRAA